MKRLFKYLSLVGAKLVGRRHDRDVDLPGMKELLNAFVSKSDSAITARPDFNPISEDLLAVSDSIDFDEADDEDDYLNSAFGIYGSDSLVWLTNRAPISYDSVLDAYQIASSIYEEGTIFVTNGSSMVIGTDTEWKTKIWAGCLLEVADSGTYYMVSSVNGDTSVTLSEAYAGSSAGTASYEVHRTHNPDHANYKANLQPFTAGMIYSNPSITMPIEEEKISGPFYASTSSTSASTTVDGWAQMEDSDIPLVGTPTTVSHGMSMAAGALEIGGNQVGAAYKLASSPYWKFYTSTAPFTEWSQAPLPSSISMSNWHGWVVYGGGYDNFPAGYPAFHTCG